MLCIQAPGTTRTWMVSFRKGDYIIEELRKLFETEGVDAALICSGIGSFDICKMHTITGVTLPPGDTLRKILGDPDAMQAFVRFCGTGRRHRANRSARW